MEQKPKEDHVLFAAVRNVNITSSLQADIGITSTCQTGRRKSKREREKGL